MAKREPPVLLIDADVFRYQMSYSNTKGIDWDGNGEITEVSQEDKARTDVDSMIVELCKKFKAQDFVLALSCRHHNFRKDVLSSYKFVRHEKPKPQLWSLIDEHIQTKYADKIVMRYGLESDDILGTLASHPSPKRATGPRIMVSIAKDLQTIPGIRLYNPKKPELDLRSISQHDADYFWIYQTLAGDSTDGYQHRHPYRHEHGGALVGLVQPLHDRRSAVQGCDRLRTVLPLVHDLYQARGFNEQLNELHAHEKLFLRREGEVLHLRLAFFGRLGAAFLAQVLQPLDGGMPTPAAALGLGDECLNGLAGGDNVLHHEASAGAGPLLRRNSVAPSRSTRCRGGWTPVPVPVDVRTRRACRSCGDPWRCNSI